MVHRLLPAELRDVIASNGRAVRSFTGNPVLSYADAMLITISDIDQGIAIAKRSRFAPPLKCEPMPTKDAIGRPNVRGGRSVPVSHAALAE